MKKFLKKCARCKVEKDLQTAFYVRKNGKIMSPCITCISEKQIAKKVKEKEDRLAKVEKIPGENWKDVVGYEHFYEVSDKGRIRTKPRQSLSGNHLVIRGVRYFTLCKHPDGYVNVGLRKESKIVKRTSVHRLVAVAFIPLVKGKDFVNHKNGIKSDNRAENLEWCTRQENVRHSFDNGLQVNPKGQDHSTAKLRDIDVLEIRRKYKPKGEYGALRLSKEYNISLTNIKDIINRKIWTHL